MEKLGNYEDSSIEILKKQGKPKLKELADKYNDVDKVDKLLAAQESVNQVAGVMNNNLQKMLDNQKDLGVIKFPFENTFFKTYVIKCLIFLGG